MNQRAVEPSTPIRPRMRPNEAAEDDHAERLMFDKAEIAGRVSSLRAKRDELKAEIASLAEVDGETQGLGLAWRQRQIEHLDDIIETLEKN